MSNKESVWGVNHGKPRQKVNHSDLERFGDSAFKSVCPVCEIGVLLVHRHPDTFVLLETDKCTFCSQTFQYEDIREMRRMDGMNAA